MAKKNYKKKDRDIEADQFDASLPEPQWPDGVIINVLSSTGWSYGTLVITVVDGVEQKDGFEVDDWDYIIYDTVPFRMTETVFLQNFMEV